MREPIALTAITRTLLSAWKRERFHVVATTVIAVPIGTRFTLTTVVVGVGHLELLGGAFCQVTRNASTPKFRMRVSTHVVFGLKM